MKRSAPLTKSNFLFHRNLLSGGAWGAAARKRISIEHKTVWLTVTFCLLIGIASSLAPARFGGVSGLIQPAQAQPPMPQEVKDALDSLTAAGWDKLKAFYEPGRKTWEIRDEYAYGGAGHYGPRSISPVLYETEAAAKERYDFLVNGLERQKARADALPWERAIETVDTGMPEKGYMHTVNYYGQQAPVLISGILKAGRWVVNLDFSPDSGRPSPFNPAKGVYINSPEVQKWEADENAWAVGAIPRTVAEMREAMPKVAQALAGDLKQAVRRVLKVLSKKPGHVAWRPASHPVDSTPVYFDASSSYSRRPAYTHLTYLPSDRPGLFTADDLMRDWSPSDEATIVRVAGGQQAATCDDLKPRVLNDKEEEQLAPDVKAIIKASKEQPERLRDILLGFLDDPDENRSVYALAMGGAGDSRVIFNNLSQKLRPNDKLLRYLRARQRYCGQKARVEFERWMTGLQFVSQILLTTMDAVLSELGVPAFALTSPLSYTDITNKMQQLGQDAEIKKNLPSDVQGLIVDTVYGIKGVDLDANRRGAPADLPTMHVKNPVKTAALWEYFLPGEYFGDVTLALGQEMGKDALKRWTAVPEPELAAAIENRVNEAKTEGEWLKRMDQERQRQAEIFLWHRAVLARFNHIFDVNRWPYDPAQYDPATPLLFGDITKAFKGHEYKKYVEARNLMIKHMEEARPQIILTAYYGGFTDYQKSAPQ
jgi:hypothetical protein